MASLIDRTVIRTTLAARPTLRANLRALICRVTNDAFDDGALRMIEADVLGSISVAEAMQMPSQMPAAGTTLALTSSQLKILNRVISRVKTPDLRDRIRHELAAAVAGDRLTVR